MRVAIYCRVSTGDGRQSAENQRIALREFCARQEGWEVTHEYTDEVSGGRPDRQQFQRPRAKSVGIPRTCFTNCPLRLEDGPSVQAAL